MLTPRFKLSLLTLCLSTSLPTLAGTVRNDIDYQYFRDFAENKGQFTPGARNISIKNLKEHVVGTMMVNTPMPDFHALSRSGVATLINPQYVISVAHNRGYGSVDFGEAGKAPDQSTFHYKLVSRNTLPTGKGAYADFHVPRLHKLVTEVAPTQMNYLGEETKPYQDPNRFSMYVRVGGGTQYTMPLSSNEKTRVGGAYSYLTGGSTPAINQGHTAKGLVYTHRGLTDSTFGPMNVEPEGGDSGSPLFAYDKIKQRWGVIGVLHGISSSSVWYILPREDFVNLTIASNHAGTINNSSANATFDWSANGISSTIRQDHYVLPVGLADTDKSNDTSSTTVSLNHGQDVTFTGKAATLNLQNHIAQGAGALTFNTDFTVKGSNNEITWEGAGVNIARDKRVDWQVKNPQGDRLSKIGEGTLYVNGIGENHGDISVGDGTVIFAQKADQQGRKQAFNQVGIVSGRPTVVLNDSQQVKPDNLYFGFRGGRLDVNGNDLTFARIRNTDEGAQIVNHNANKASTITIDAEKKHLTWGNWRQHGADIYEYINIHAKNRTDYFLLKPNGNPGRYYPTNQTSSNDWQFIGSDKEQAIKIAKTIETSTFAGIFGETDPRKVNGRLNVVFKPTSENAQLLLTGGMALNGTFSTNNGTVILSGKPTPHAYDMNQKQDVVHDDEWINRHFTAENFSVHNNGKLYVSRNVETINGNFTASQHALIQLGAVNNTPVCQRSDYTGETSCSKPIFSQKIWRSMPTLQAKGNAILNDHSRLVIGKTHFLGTVQGTPQSQVTLAFNANWTMTGDSTLGNLTLDGGADVYLNNADKSTVSRYNHLVINGKLSGNGHFHALTNVAEQKGDHVTVNGLASGNFLFSIENTGREPNAVSPLSLLTLTNPKQNLQQLNVQLKNGYVDLGTYRYILKNERNDYRLYSPLRDAQQQNPAEQAEIDKAKALAQRYQTELNNLQADLRQKQIEQQQAQKNLVNKQQEVYAKEDYINRLHWIRFISRAIAKSQLQKLQQEVANYSTLAQQVNTAISDLNRLLVDTAYQVNEAQQHYTAMAATSSILKQAEALCLQSNSSQVCQAVVNTLGVNELENLAYRAASGDLSEEEFDAFRREVLDAIAAEDERAATTDIAQRAGISRYANTALSEISAQVNNLLQMTGSNNHAITTYRNDPFSVWVSTTYQQAKFGSDNYRDYRQHSTLTQIGLESAVNNYLHFGGILSNINANNDFDQASGNSKLTMLTVYGKYQSEDGWLAALELGYGTSRNRLNIDNQTEKFHRRITSMGVTLSKRWENNGWLAQPYIGAKYYHLSGVDYQLNGANISVKSFGLPVYQAGINVAKHFDFEAFSITPRFTSEYIDARRKVFGIDVFKVNNIQLKQRFARHFKHEIGFDVKMRNWEISTHIGLLKGDEMKHQHYAGLTLGYHW
ncbi:Immunoglobulin A1 protease autotransporter precursor [[Pasteurella] mairii]|uniref:Immunoglobulin A1 protease autotransporter n=1 Tax=[Pasteurella] mairii TaxID=757 RepID=A0A379B1S6_9PAST|nr:Immunoglobulin A1 protease autotransporter precursor [[Pasteurella] mairii]